MVTRAFDFADSGGRRLSARLELPDIEPRGWALFAHCFTCGKDNMAAVRVSRTLAAAGIGVLRFDFAGIGQSEGDFAQTTFASNVADLIAASLAMSNAGMAPDLVVGHSLGGAAAVAAAKDIPSAKAVATIGAPFDVSNVLRQFDPAMLARIREEGEADVELGGRTFHVGRAFVNDVETHSQMERAAGLGRPLLILHSPTDRVVGIDHATRLYAAARHPKSLVSLDDADHLLWRKEDAEYVGQVIATWAARYLRPVPEKRSTGQVGDVVAEETRAGRYQVTIHAGGTHFLADEPESVGGLGSGPTPYDLLSAALAACTTMTLRLYIDRKGWEVERVRTAVGYMREPGTERPDVFDRRISIDGELAADQMARLLEIADKCPVHQTLVRGSRMQTGLSDPPAEADPVDTHAQTMSDMVDA